MRLVTRVVMMSLTLGIAVPVQAQSSSRLPLPSDSTIAAPVDTSGAVRDTVVVTARGDSTQRAVAQPRPRDLRVAAHYATTRESTAPTLLLQRRRAGLGQPMAMMIVGGAAVLLGAIIGDTPGTVIMIGGAVIGLIGLYEYLQ